MIGRALYRVLMFMNLMDELHPERLSISKTAVWLAMVVFTYIALTTPTNLAAMGGAVGAAIPAILNYALSKWQAHQERMASVPSVVVEKTTGPPPTTTTTTTLTGTPAAMPGQGQ
jgi:hypothetical protein